MYSAWCVGPDEISLANRQLRSDDKRRERVWAVPCFRILSLGRPIGPSAQRPPPSGVIGVQEETPWSGAASSALRSEQVTLSIALHSFHLFIQLCTGYEYEREQLGVRLK